MKFFPRWVAWLLLFMPFALAAAQPVAPPASDSTGAPASPPPARPATQATASRAATIPAIDRTRLAEAFRLADKIGDRLWAEWSRAPFAVLLVTGDLEFLVRHPRPPSSFRSIGRDSLLQSEVWTRPRQYDPHFLATFFVEGVPTIVIGQAESTQVKTSTSWVTTLLHEHFHQLQYSRPDYQAKVKALDLARGDTTGLWMLEYPFPYRDPETVRRFTHMRSQLDSALHAPPARFRSVWSAYLDVRKQTHATLGADDAKYLAFQLWQEGIARYTEVRIASMAAAGYKPSAAFRALPDYHSFADEAARAMSRLERELAMPLDNVGRTAFYSIGAAEGLLLDRTHPGWRSRYFEHTFEVSPALTGK